MDRRSAASTECEGETRPKAPRAARETVSGRHPSPPLSSSDITTLTALPPPAKGIRTPQAALPRLCRSCATPLGRKVAVAVPLVVVVEVVEEGDAEPAEAKRRPA